MKSLFVSPHGADTWTGLSATPGDDGEQGPFATLERARDEIRRWKASGDLTEPVTVFLRQGRYELHRTLILETQDSGSNQVPIVYRSFPAETAILTGGRRLVHRAPVADNPGSRRLPDAAALKVVCFQLSANAVTDFGSPTAPDERPELFFDNRPMILARWPNEGFSTVKEVIGGDPLLCTASPGIGSATSSTRVTGLNGGSMNPNCGSMVTGFGIGRTRFNG